MNDDFIALARLATAHDGMGEYGIPRWKANLVDNLGVNKRTIDRWASGDADVPQGVWEEMIELAALNLDKLAGMGLFVYPEHGMIADVYISGWIAEDLLAELDQPGLYLDWKTALKRIIEKNKK